MKVVAIVPAYNEAKNIKPVLNCLKKAAILDDILVVDDGSSDNTSEIVKNIGFEVLTLSKNSGKGSALEAGINAKKDTDIYFFVDADLVGLTEDHINQLIKPLIDDSEISMTVGKFVGGRKRTDWAQNLVPQISGQRALRKELAHSLPDLKKEGFGVEVTITRFAKKSGYKSKEIMLYNITQVMKEEKLGYIRGFYYRLVMYAHILRSLFKKTA